MIHLDEKRAIRRSDAFGVAYTEVISNRRPREGRTAGGRIWLESYSLAPFLKVAAAAKQRSIALRGR